MDYHQTFTPVAKMVTGRTLLTFAASRNWVIHQMYIYNAFLHSDLTKKIYNKLLLGFLNGHEGQAYWLKNHFMGSNKLLMGYPYGRKCWIVYALDSSIHVM